MQKIIPQTKDLSLPTIVSKKCLICNSCFEVKRKEIWAGRGKLCSKECTIKSNSILSSLRAQKNRIEKQCKVCNKFIYIKLSHSEKTGTYCSKECMSNDYSIILKGNNNPNFKNKDSNTKEYASANSFKRRIRKNNNKDELSLIDIKELVKNSDRCYWCEEKLNKKNKNKVHIDHYTPISKGGDNALYNIVISCAKCNLSKSAKDPIVFANSIGKLL